MLNRTIQVIIGTTLTAMLLAAAAAQVAGQCIPNGMPRTPVMSYKYTNWCLSSMDPGLARRTNRIIIRKGAGTVGVRVEWTNAAPVAMHYSMDGRVWQPLCAVTNGTQVVVDVSAPSAFFRVQSNP